MFNRSSLLLAGFLSLAAVPTLSSCNAITGASDLELRDLDEEEDDGPEPDKTVEAGGVSITEVAIYQGVKRPLMKDGAPVMTDIPIVADRGALVRVFVKTDPTYNNLPVTGRLYLGSAVTPIEDARILSGPSSDADLESTINLNVPLGRIKTGTTLRIELRQQPGASPSTGNAKYPATGAQPLDVQSDGTTLKIVLVPVEYQADSSKRLPDTSAEQIKIYKDYFYGFYPIPKVEVTVREPMPWTDAIEPFGGGWEYLLNAVGDLRQKDGAAPDEYYYGVFSPMQSEGQFCQSGCVLGLANLAGPGNPSLRAGIGLGYTGTTSAETAVHEVGHTHGRQHSPCGMPDGPDPNYPHSGGVIGVWGYDLVNKKLWNPDSAKDVMGYCSPMWVSDFTFNALFERMKSVNVVSMKVSPEMRNRVYERAMVDGKGAIKWLSSLREDLPPVGFETKTVTVQTAGRTETITGQWFPYDHIEGGILMWPELSKPASMIKVEIGGKLRTLSR